MGHIRALTLLLAELLVSERAFGEPPRVVRLGGVCVPDGTSTERTLSILQAELAPADVTRLAESVPAPGTTVVVIGLSECTSAPPGARVTVWTNGAPRTRLVSFADADPEARDRTLALALAEATRDLAFAYLEGAAPTEAVPADTPLVAESPAPAPTPGPIGTAAPAPIGAAPTTQMATSVRASGAGKDDVYPRAGALVRFVASPSTFLGGGELGAAFHRVALVLRVLGTARTVSIGTTRLLAIVAAPSFDVVEIFPRTQLRLGLEAGFATASAEARPPATGKPASATHFAGGLGIRTLVPLGESLSVDGSIDGGYASSLTASADGREIAGLRGVFVEVGIGLEFPWK